MIRTPSCPTCRKNYVDVIKVYGQFQLCQDNFVLTDELLTKITQMETTIAHLNGELTAKKNQIKKIEGQCKQLLSEKEKGSKSLQSKLKENANTISELNNLVNMLKTEVKTQCGQNPSAKLNAKNIELKKTNDDLLQRMGDLKAKLTAKSSELDRCQKAAAQKNKAIKELKKSELKCNVPEHKIKAHGPDLKRELELLQVAFSNVAMENTFLKFMYHD